jgi:hypothetical protein
LSVRFANVFAVCSPGNGQGRGKALALNCIESGVSGCPKSLRIFRLGETLGAIRFCVVFKDSEVRVWFALLGFEI